MRKLLASTFVSLDGYMAGPKGPMDMGWFMDTFTPDMGQEFAKSQSTQDTVLLGENTYHIFVNYWPKQPDTNPAAAFINHAKKIIVSDKLTEVNWGDFGNATLLGGELREAVTELKKQPGKDIVVAGSGSIVQQLTQWGLIDEYQLFVEPIVLGGGLKLWNVKDRFHLRLMRARAFDSGAVVLYYQPVKEDEKK